MVTVSEALKETLKTYVSPDEDEDIGDIDKSYVRGLKTAINIAVAIEQEQDKVYGEW